MKTLLTLFAALCISVSFAQTYDTGDATLDADLAKIDAAKGDDVDTYDRQILVGQGMGGATVKAMNDIGMSSAEKLLAAVISNTYKIDIDKIMGTYKDQKADGWDSVFNTLGIKYDSAYFQTVKDKIHSKAK